MSAATILFMDVAGFSKKSTSEQSRLVNALTVEVLHELRILLMPPSGKLNVLPLPTGDGMALAFMHDSVQKWDLMTILCLIVRLQKWAFQETTETELVRIRFGVHLGRVELLTDINGKLNICGDTINYTQRIMDAANPMQVLFSDTAFREYVGAESPLVNISQCSEHLEARFVGPIEVFAKHGLRIPIYKLILEPEENWWENNDPIAKELMLVSLTPLPKEIVGSFSAQIGRATHIAFIQLTGDRFLDKFKENKINFSSDLKRFWVFMPDPEAYECLHIHTPYAQVNFVTDSIDKWREFFTSLKQDYPNADLKLGLFKEPPHFGASFIDWERSGGTIHISPYVWNVSAPKCPGYDLQWIGNKPSPIYEVYTEGLNYLNSKTSNVILDR